MRVHWFMIAMLGIVAAASSASAAEICGNGVDDDANGHADEGCYSGLTTGVCESPLSCHETGMVSPLKGGLHYQLPADVAPKVPYGPGIGLRRFYTSLYEPGASAPAWKKPMGERWQHTYMTWLAKTGVAPSSTLMLHTSRGRDVLATYQSSSSGWDYYTPQAGYHAHYLRQRQAAPNEYQLRLLTGETLVYNSAGQLIEIWDTLATPNKVQVTYDGAGQVSTVTDASTKRRLVFEYTGGLLTSVQFQVKIAGTFTTYHTTTYGYTGGNLASVTIGGQLAQTNVYAGDYLTQIHDGDGKSLIAFDYTAIPGTIARIDATSGTLGYEYNSPRSSCAGKTVLYFNLGNTSTCDVDADCGSGFLCGGKTGTGSTGRCFRAARCLTVTSPSEDVITSVTALGPPGETCEGACLEASQYVWNTGSGVLDLAAVQDPSGNYTAKQLNAYGLPTRISFGDTDADPTNGGGERETFIAYDATFPGKVAEVRRQSDLGTGATCTSSGGTCATTTYSYNADGKLQSVVQSGYTLVPGNYTATYTYTTAYTYDGKGRLTQIDGPLAGANDITQFTYHAATGGLDDDFLHEYKRKKDASSFLTYKARAYDYWGNPTALEDADGTLTCLAFDGARGYLKKRREAMAGGTSCLEAATDLVTQWHRDSALRLELVERPDGSCLYYEYDSKGRLARTKRRDDCVPSSPGDRQEFVYDAEGLLTEIQTYDDANILTAKQSFTYHDSRRLARIVNPVNASSWTGITYDARGLVQQIDASGGLGRTVFDRSHPSGAPQREGRVTAVEKYKTSTTFDRWNLLYSWLGLQTSVTDGDAKTTETVRDDLGRVVRITSPDLDAPRLQFYDAASRLVQRVELYGIGAQRVHEFTHDHLGRPLSEDYAVGATDGGCGGASNPPEIQRVYDAPPVACPIIGGCNRTVGRLAYEKVRLMCKTGLGSDYSLDQETFYSYDDAGRVTREYIRDDAGRVAEHAYAWNRNGDLEEVVMPSGIALGWKYGSTGNNSDSELIAQQWWDQTTNVVTDSVSWYPYGPLEAYKHSSTYGGSSTATRIARNLAYRITGIYYEAGSTLLHSVTTSEDAKGRITKRDYTPNIAGVEDSYFLYDDQDRLLCETTSLVTSCPTSGSTIKNSHVASPPFTNAGDWKELKRPIPGSTNLGHVFNPSGYGSSHRVTQIVQDDFMDTNYTYLPIGARSTEDNVTLSHDERVHGYDQRHNKTTTTGWYRDGGTWYGYTAQSAFDAKNRRVYKSFTANKTTATWFFYYDPLDRLTEVLYTPDASAPGTYQLFHLLWIGDRLTAYVQIDMPKKGISKRYVMTDEMNRPVEMWYWPGLGDTTRVWAINPSAWGFDTNVLGSSYFQPVLFAGQYQDPETGAYQDDGTTIHRPGLVAVSCGRSCKPYDPFVGGFLHVPEEGSEGAVAHAKHASMDATLRPEQFLSVILENVASVPTPDRIRYSTKRSFIVPFYFSSRQCNSWFNDVVADLVLTQGSAGGAMPNAAAQSPGSALLESGLSRGGFARLFQDCFTRGWYRGIHVTCEESQCSATPGEVCQVDDLSAGPYMGYVFQPGELGTEKPGVHMSDAYNIGSCTCQCAGAVINGEPACCGGLPPGVGDPGGDIPGRT